MVVKALGICVPLSGDFKLMATVVLQYAGAAIGTALGGPIGGMIGRAVGAVAGSIIDQQIFGSENHREGPRQNNLRVMASDEGAPIPAVFGRMRISGQVIWASNFEEIANTSTQKTSAKGGPKSTSTDYSYYANFAVGLCEGQIDGIGRVWADGTEIDIEKFSPRIYLGTETQTADSLISTLEGAAPAYRGVAYIVFEKMPLSQFGNRLPQLSFEIIKAGNAAANAVRGISIIPGATEFGYDTRLVSRSTGAGVTQTENAHVSAERTDFSIAINQLQDTAKNVDCVSLVVSWFGTDLRCGACLVKPGVDNATKQTSPSEWQVSGTLRGGAYPISQIAGASAFGGTPSDGSVIRAIQDLHTRGLKVMFYPFILMDIAAGNVLPDPYGGSAQAPYPWRGRITANVAPGLAGTPNKTAAAATQIAQFVGTAQPSHFASAGDTITYSGPAEWSFRRMILHYAKLCAAAGGVEAFVLSSELVGLSTLRSAANTYPFVAALQTLAAEVKTILPTAKISYAADWTEYFGHQPNDGTNDCYFHLDALWASPSIDFVGIDNYLPLTDWRDGATHLDYLAGTKSIYDISYLQAGIASGEYFDWYYASQNNRDAQIRTTITDSTYNKPWVFRPKDLKSWWANLHYNRPAGVQAATPTGWVPQSKPIWFTETGCPAIDKGSNSPNAFYDAKSAESTVPAYSNGDPDAQMQNAFLRAVQSYWETSPQNSTSILYSGKMVDPSRIFYWTWDSRPFPAFPSRTEIWSDAENYARGHWLNGRLAAVDLGELIKTIAARFGFSNCNVDRVEGIVDGFVIDRPLSARDALEGLLQSFAIDIIESEGTLIFQSRRNATVLLILNDDLIDEGENKPLLVQTRAQETELASAIRLGFVDSSLDYRSAAVAQRKTGTGSLRELSFSMPAALNQTQAQMRVDVALAESWAARETAVFGLPPHFARLEVGDVIILNTARWRVKTISDGAFRKIEAQSFDKNVFDPPTGTKRNTSFASPSIYGQPDYVTMDAAWAGASAAIRIAAHATPWPGSLALYKKSGASSFVLNRVIEQQATIATTLTTLQSGVLDRVDYTTSLTVKMRFGALLSAARDEILNGINLAAIGTAASGFELIQFETANLIATDTYELKGLLRGRFGSSAEMLNVRVAGQDVVLLNGAVVQPEIAMSEAGLATTWRLGPSTLDHGHPAFVEFTTTGQLKPLRPLPPVRLQAEKMGADQKISWIRCTRIDGDSWDLAEVPLSETTELYQIDILNGLTKLRSATVTSPQFNYLAADMAADFGATPTSFTARVAQVSATFGAGVPTERIIYV
jgi:GTA TIM-barrel-like domain/Putative phage tail protein